MSIAVAHLLEEALLLPMESRTELVEAILERSEPSDEFIDQQVKIVTQRMHRVREGASSVIPAEEAHDMVLASLKLRQ